MWPCGSANYQAPVGCVEATDQYFNQAPLIPAAQGRLQRSVHPAWRHAI